MGLDLTGVIPPLVTPFKANGDIDEAVGTSMMYRRVAWDNRRFPACNIGEDTAFQFGRHVVTAYGHRPSPQMVATHHGKNISTEDGRFVQSTRYVETAWSQVHDQATICELLKIASV